MGGAAWQEESNEIRFPNMPEYFQSYFCIFAWQTIQTERLHPRLAPKSHCFLCLFPLLPPLYVLAVPSLTPPPNRVTSADVKKLPIETPPFSPDASRSEHHHRSIASSSAAFQKWWLCDPPLSLILEVQRSDFSSPAPSLHSCAYCISCGRRLLRLHKSNISCVY